MANLGLWAPFINEAEMNAHYHLPPEMLPEVERYRPDGRELDPLPKRTFQRLHRRTIAYARHSVEPFDPPYHNDRTHFAAVEANGLAAISGYAELTGQAVPTAVCQAYRLALRLHDAHHCASTFRVDAPHGMYSPELGTSVSSEWVTSIAVNQFMRNHGLVLPARIFQTGVIWDSTFGGGTARGRVLHIPNVHPQNVWGAGMRAADVCPPESIEEWLRNAVAVNYGEVPGTKPPDTLRGFVAAQLEFAGYIERTFDQLDHAAGKPVAKAIGWRKRLDGLRRKLDVLQSGDRQLIRLVYTETKRYGMTLA